jgi:hypothetical protein
MRMSEYFVISILLLAATSATSLLNASDIYSDPNADGGWAVAGGEGDEITAAGTDRLVTELDVGIDGQSNPGNGVFVAKLFANDGQSGQPGSLLWESGYTNATFPGGATTLTFDVPQVLVPDTFTWMVYCVSSVGGPPAVLTAGAPTVGTHDVGWFYVPYDGWGEDESAHVAEIDAIPEPSSLLLTALGVAALWVGGRRRRKGPSHAP